MLCQLLITPYALDEENNRSSCTTSPVVGGKCVHIEHQHRANFGARLYLFSGCDLHLLRRPRAPSALISTPCHTLAGPMGSRLAPRCPVAR
jgi:hypothetical protein